MVVAFRFFVMYLYCIIPIRVFSQLTNPDLNVENDDELRLSLTGIKTKKIWYQITAFISEVNFNKYLSLYKG